MKVRASAPLVAKLSTLSPAHPSDADASTVGRCDVEIPERRPAISSPRARWHSGLMHSGSRLLVAAAATTRNVRCEWFGGRADMLAPLGPLDDGGRVTYFIAAPPSRRRNPARRRGARGLGARVLAARGRRRTDVRPRRERGRGAREGLLGSQPPAASTARCARSRSTADAVRRSTFGRTPRPSARRSPTRARLDALFRDTIVYLTCLHELGHALGLAHTADFADVMYFFGFGGDITEFFGRYRRTLRSARRHSCLIWVVARGSRAARGPVWTRCRARRAHGSELAGNTGA